MYLIHLQSELLDVELHFTSYLLWCLLTSHGAVITSSWHSQLALNLGLLGNASILYAHLGLASPAYPFISQDWSTTVSVFTDHAWIGGFFIVGAGTHAAIFLVLDYLERLLSHRHTYSRTTSLTLYLHITLFQPWGSRRISSWTAFLNSTPPVIRLVESSQCCTALGTQLLETSYGNGSGNLPRTGNEASLRCDTCIAGRMKRASRT